MVLDEKNRYPLLKEIHDNNGSALTRIFSSPIDTYHSSKDREICGKAEAEYQRLFTERLPYADFDGQVNQNGENALMLAARNHPKASAALLKDIKALPEDIQNRAFTQVNTDGKNALMLAAQYHPKLLGPILSVMPKALKQRAVERRGLARIFKGQTIIDAIFTSNQAGLALMLLQEGSVCANGNAFKDMVSHKRQLLDYIMGLDEKERYPLLKEIHKSKKDSLLAGVFEARRGLFKPQRHKGILGLAESEYLKLNKQFAQEKMTNKDAAAQESSDAIIKSKLEEPAAQLRHKQKLYPVIPVSSVAPRDEGEDLTFLSSEELALYRKSEAQVQAARRNGAKLKEGYRALPELVSPRPIPSAPPAQTSYNLHEDKKNTRDVMDAGLLIDLSYGSSAGKTERISDGEKDLEGMDYPTKPGSLLAPSSPGSPAIQCRASTLHVQAVSDATAPVTTQSKLKQARLILRGGSPIFTKATSQGDDLVSASRNAIKTQCPNTTTNPRSLLNLPSVPVAALSGTGNIRQAVRA